jgi:hypothetical protein
MPFVAMAFFGQCWDPIVPPESTHASLGVHASRLIFHMGPAPGSLPACLYVCACFALLCAGTGHRTWPDFGVF